MKTMNHHPLHLSYYVFHSTSQKLYSPFRLPHLISLHTTSCHFRPRAYLCIPYAEAGIMLCLGTGPLFSNVYLLHSISAPSSVQRSLQSHDETSYQTIISPIFNMWPLLGLNKAAT